VVFVADSQSSMHESNLDSLENLKTNLRINRINPDKVALVFQYNKRDLPNVDSVEEMNAYLNPGGAVPIVEASAINGTGVTATLRAAVAKILDNLKNNVDTTLYEEPELRAPDMSVRSGVGTSSATRLSMKNTTPEPVEEDPFGAVAVIEESGENPFDAVAAELHDPAAERGELEAFLSSATEVVRSLERALEQARRHESDLRARLS